MILCQILIFRFRWNSAVEQQAFGRIYRIGQDKETLMVQTIMKGSVEERMCRLKASKDIAINGVMSKHAQYMTCVYVSLLHPSRSLTIMFQVQRLS